MRYADCCYGDVHIVGIARTPMGDFSGSLSSLSAVELGTIAIKEALSRAGVSGDDVSEVFFGNVLSAGVGQAPARQAAINAGVSVSTPCTTINKVCSSGMKAVTLAAQTIALGHGDIIIAGGMESMSNTPYYLPKARAGMRYGHGEVNDGVLLDGLTDPFDGSSMGLAGELCAETNNLSRADQDEYALESFRRAAEAAEAGKFADEIVAVEVGGRKPVTVEADEHVGKLIPEKFHKLRTVFKEDGTVTAGNASPLSDGAAALVLASSAAVAEKGLTVLATIRGYADAAQESNMFTMSPSLAVPKALDRAGLDVAAVDYFEINEAFSAVALANAAVLGVSLDKVNVFGGAVSMGHPLGCSGARVIMTLMSVLKDKGGKIGVAGICNGGGGASAIVIERPTEE